MVRDLKCFGPLQKVKKKNVCKISSALSVAVHEMKTDTRCFDELAMGFRLASKRAASSEAKRKEIAENWARR